MAQPKPTTCWPTALRQAQGKTLGSVRAEMVGDAIDSATTYEPYGKLLAQSGSSGTHYDYTGEQHDDATGLLYLRARYYNPGLRLFLSKDPWPGSTYRPQTMHGWVYVENNPVNRIDPTGRQSDCSLGTCGPDATDWLRGEMARHYTYGIHLQTLRAKMTMRGLGIIPGTVVPLAFIADETPFKDIIGMGNDKDVGWRLLAAHPINSLVTKEVIGGLSLLEFGLYGLAVDYSAVIYQSGNSSCGTGECNEFDVGDGSFKSLLTLCGYCIDSSDIGNMMFGLGGAGRGYDLFETWHYANMFNISQGEGFYSPDGRGTIPGYVIALQRAYQNKEIMR